MSLLFSLPLEILQDIIRYIGQTHFLQEPEHLLLCKQWYHNVQSAFEVWFLGERDLMCLDKSAVLWNFMSTSTRALSVQLASSFPSEPTGINEDAMNDALCDLVETLPAWSKLKVLCLQTPHDRDPSFLLPGGPHKADSVLIQLGG